MLRKAVLATVAYYDALEYPLTEFEIWKHLIADNAEASLNAYELGEIAAAVDGLVDRGAVSRFRGLVFLSGRQSLVHERIRSEKYSVAKIKRAARLAQRISWVPFVRMIALTGSLSMKRGDSDSDWDLFVVLSRGAIWRGRTWLSLVLHIMGKRRHGRHIENRACLNYFVTDGSLEIAMQDYFSASEYRFMYTLLGRDTERRFELVNRWIARVKPNYQLSEIPNIWLRDPSPASLMVRSWLERMFSFPELEGQLSNWQKKKIERNPKSHIPGAFIVANDEALIFLPHPKGPAVFDRYKERLSLHGFTT